jgi:hypothetical protein
MRTVPSSKDSSRIERVSQPAWPSGLRGTSICFATWLSSAYRFNNRKMSDAERFSLPISGIVGKRLMFDQLTNKRPDSRLQVN